MKLRNKLMGLAVAAVMVVSAAVGLTPATAQAAGTNLKLVPSATEVKAGETFDVAIKLENNTGLTALVIRTSYEDADFESVTVKDAGLLAGYSAQSTTKAMMWKDPAAAENNTANGTIATLTFKVKADVAVKDLVIGLEVRDAMNVNYEEVVVAANGTTVSIECDHNYTWTVEKEATCTEEGLEKGVCSVCGDETTRPITAKGHTAGEWEVVTEATCGAKGLKVKKCTVCGEVVEEEEIAATGKHVDADKDGKCDVCGSTIKSPTTGDNTAVMLWMTLAVVAAVVVFNKKRINA